MKTEVTLQLMVENDWVAETISFLGSGFLYHLAYPVEAIQPETLFDLRAGVLQEGAGVEVIFCANYTLYRIALGELVRINDFGSFIRLDFRLLRTIPSLKEYKTSEQKAYSCCYET